MSEKRTLLIPLLGMIFAAWGGGMISVGYLIGSTNPINTINAFGVILVGLGLAIVIKSLSVLKNMLEIEVE